MTPESGLPGSQLRQIDISRISRLLGIVRIANIWLVIVGGQFLLFILTRFIWALHSAVEIASTAIYAVVLAFSIWVGWKNVGGLGAVTQRYTALVLLLVTLGSLNTGIALRIAGASLAGLLALIVLRFLRIPGLGVKLSSFLRRALPQGRSKALSLPPMNKRKGFLFVGMGIAWLFASPFLASLIPDPEISQKFDIVVGVIGFTFLVYARHYLRPDFQAVRSADSRPPVLLLRSFEDDEKLRYIRADTALFDFSLESRLADHFSAVGPFIAVGKPGDMSPHLGAARASLLDNEWQGTVIGWMVESSLIIVMIGSTHWVGWELERIIELGHTAKLILLFPETRKWFPSRRRKAAEQRLQVVRRAFAGTPWSTALKFLTKPERIRSMIYLPSGGLVTVVSSSRNRESHHMAALIAQHLRVSE